MKARHADILKMAKTQEKRDLILWFHARHVFLCCGPIAKGLELAKECSHQDARFLVSLFPNGVPAEEDVGSVLLSLAFANRDPRAVCWAAMCHAEPGGKLTRGAAEKGCALAQAMYTYRLDADDEKVAWLNKAIAQGERYGFSLLGDLYWEHGNVEGARRMWQEAAELGDPDSQYNLGWRCCAQGSVEQIDWWRRCVMQGVDDCPGAWYKVRDLCVDELQKFNLGGSGRVVFALGEAYRDIVTLGQPSLQHIWERKELEAAAAKVSVLHARWCTEAKRAVLCWIWLAQQKGVVKDIRLLVANLIWDGRAAWSERAADATDSLESCSKNAKSDEKQ